ncbi:MAG TPA: hypothetical protein G4N96_02540 [Chloroflexi bacterium]|nr:hypothetical protein [Chloroflexota bacterium]
MKKLIILSITLLMLTTACGQADAPTVETEAQAVVPTAEATKTPLPTPSPTPKALETVEIVNDGSVSPLARSVSPVEKPATEIGGAMDISTLPAKTQEMIQKSKEMLVDLLGDGLKAEEVSVVSVESREWRDGSLGCPKPGMMYTQATTSGYLIVLEAGGRQYEFHTGGVNSGVLCKIDGKPAWEALKQ